MTTAAEELDRLISTTIQAWARVHGAWLQAMSDAAITVQDLNPVETNVVASNQAHVDIPAQANDTPLVMGPLTLGGATIAPSCVTISPSAVDANTPTRVLVTVEPPKGIPSGTYDGPVKSAAGATLGMAFVTVNPPT